MTDQDDTPQKESEQEDSFHGWGGLSFLRVIFPQKQDSRNGVPTEGDTASHLPTPLIFSAFIIVALGFVGYETYFNVKSDTTIGKTLQSSDSLEQGLVGHWTFDGPDMDWSSSTGEVRDISSYHNNGDLMNSSMKSATPGRLGQGMEFNGTTNYISAPAEDTNFVGALTISAWVKPNGSSNIVAKCLNNGPTFNPFDFALSNMSGVNVFYSVRAGSSDYSAFKGGTWTANEWQHMVVTYANGNVATAPTYYRNGVSYSAINITPGTGTVAGAGKPILIGARDDSKGTVGMNGSLDDVRIYNRALTSEEITKLYNLGKGTTIGTCGAGGVKDASGNTYGIVQIGTQCWLDRNMNVGTRISGATNQTNNATIEKYCYNNLDSNCTSNNPKRPDGGLYQWNEAMQYSTTSGAQGICPSGWHIPTDGEWYTLENFLKDKGATCDAGRSSWECTGSGTKLKSGGSSRFEANLAGYMDGGVFYSGSTSGFFWSSSDGGANALIRYFNSVNATVNRVGNFKGYGFSVRCLKDS